MRNRNVGNFLPEGQTKPVFQIFDCFSDAWVFEQADRIIEVEDIEICGRKQQCGRNCRQKCHADAKAKRSAVGQTQPQIQNPGDEYADQRHHQAALEQNGLCRKIKQGRAQRQDQGVKGPKSDYGQKRHLLAHERFSVLNKIHDLCIADFCAVAPSTVFLVEMHYYLVETFGASRAVNDSLTTFLR